MAGDSSNSNTAAAAVSSVGSMRIGSAGSLKHTQIGMVSEDKRVMENPENLQKLVEKLEMERLKKDMGIAQSSHGPLLVNADGFSAGLPLEEENDQSILDKHLGRMDWSDDNSPLPETASDHHHRAMRDSFGMGGGLRGNVGGVGGLVGGGVGGGLGGDVVGTSMRHHHPPRSMSYRRSTTATTGGAVGNPGAGLMPMDAGSMMRSRNDPRWLIRLGFWFMG